MNLFPVNLNIENKLCVIVGGGKVGERKVLNLIKYNPLIKVVSKKFSKKILELNEKNVELVRDSYKPEYLKGAFIVFICTDNKELNLKIFEHAKQEHALVNIVTHPQLCDFSVSATVDRGNLKLTVSTNGISPALSKTIREELERKYGDEYHKLLEIMKEIREKQLSLNRQQSENKELFYTLLKSDILDAIKNNNHAKTEEIITNIFKFKIKTKLC